MLARNFPDCSLRFRRAGAICASKRKWAVNLVSAVNFDDCSLYDKSSTLSWTWFLLNHLSSAPFKQTSQELGWASYPMWPLPTLLVEYMQAFTKSSLACDPPLWCDVRLRRHFHAHRRCVRHHCRYVYHLCCSMLEQLMGYCWFVLVSLIVV